MSRPKVLHVALADAPTDVLVYLVDHGPTSSQGLLAAAPDDADAPNLTLARAVGLLVDLGYVARPPEPTAFSPWSATPEGIAAVAAARSAAPSTKEQR